MGRLRSRVQALRASTYHSSTSWVFLTTTFGFGLCWALFMIYVVTALSCVAAIGITLASPRFGIAPIDLFWYGFVLLGLLTFVNTVRYRPSRQHYSHRVFEALLIFFCLVTVSEWENKVHPGIGDRPIMEFIHDRVVMNIPFFQTDEFYLEEVRDFAYIDPPSGVEPGSFPELEGSAAHVDDTRFPLGILGRKASDCGCLTGTEEITRRTHYEVDAAEYYGFLNPYEAADYRSALGPRPTEADWCPAVRELARLPRDGF